MNMKIRGDRRPTGANERPWPMPRLLALWFLGFGVFFFPSAQADLSITALSQDPPNPVPVGVSLSYNVEVQASPAPNGGNEFVEVTILSQGQNISGEFSSPTCALDGIFFCDSLQSGQSDTFVFTRDPPQPVGSALITIDVGCTPNCSGDSRTINTVVEDPTGLRIVSGNGQSGPVGATLAPFVVRFVGPDGQPLAERNVDWSVSPQGAGDLQSTATSTDGNGEASNTLTIRQSGPITVTAGAFFGANGTTRYEVEFSVNGGLVDDSGLSETQRSVLNALNNACPAISALEVRTPEQQDLLNTCNQVANSNTLGSDLDALSARDDIAQTDSAMESRFTQNRNLLIRMSNLRQGAQGVDVSGLTLGAYGLAFNAEQLGQLFRKEGGGASAEEDSPLGRWGVFITGVASFGDVDATNDTPKYDFNTKGITAGIDYRFTDSLIIGTAFGYANADSDVKGNSSNTDQDSYSLSLYSTYYHGENFYLEGLLSYGWDDYKTRREVSFGSVRQKAKAEPDGNQYAISLGGGYDFSRGGLTFGPYGSFNYVNVEIDSYREKASNPGAPGFGSLLSVNNQDVESVTTVLGGQTTYAISTRYGVFLPQLRFDWQHEFRNNNRRITTRFLSDPTSTAFGVANENRDRDVFNLGVGVTATLAHGKSAFIYYERLLGDEDVTRNMFSAGFRMEF